MMKYEFTLKFRLADPQANPEPYADLRYAQSCNDAIIGIGRKGRT
jgi:hypothetical protein